MAAKVVQAERRTKRIHSFLFLCQQAQILPWTNANYTNVTNPAGVIRFNSMF
jgi:hypothetical protein